MNVRDDQNRIISHSEGWQYVCECRCDDNTTQKFEDENGRVYIPKYHIVSGRCDVSAGDEIRCIVRGTEQVRGEGRVFNNPKCNYLNYMSIYV